MCDYSLQAVASRPARVGEKLKTHRFSSGTTGFTSLDPADPIVAVCCLPGTELAFDQMIEKDSDSFVNSVSLHSRTAIFRQVNKDHERMHHDALEISDGSVHLLHHVKIGLTATVLQLPAAPKSEAEKEEQRRVEYSG